MGQSYNTSFLSDFVTDLVGHRTEVVWYDDMPTGLVGQANWNTIRLHGSLARSNDPFLPEAFFHELGHVLLHKRVADKHLSISDEECEKEARIFAKRMVMELGKDFVWNALGKGLDSDLQRRAKSEILTFANSKIFKRNRIMEANTYGQRRTTTQPQRMTATALEAQAQRELALAAKVTDPKVAAMIRKSAQSKLEVSRGNGRQSASRTQVDAPMQYATPYRR